MPYAQFLNSASSDTIAEFEALLQMASAGAPLFTSAWMDLAHFISFTPLNWASADGGWVREAASNIVIDPVMAATFFMERRVLLGLEASSFST